MPDPKKLCFIIMPFKDDMKDVYREAIKPACEKAGFVSLRVDELKGAFNINRKIIEHIFSSDAIIADLTDWNPNVFYEMGVAYAIDNKTITIVATFLTAPEPDFPVWILVSCHSCFARQFPPHE